MAKIKDKLTRRERRAIEKEERRRLEEEKRKAEYRYRIIESTQELIPVKDIYNGVVVTKDNRYIKILEFKPLNFAYQTTSEKNNIIAGFASMLKATPVDIQFKVVSKKADVDNSIAAVREYWEQETDPNRKHMLEVYMDLLQKTSLQVGISRRFFIILKHVNTINNDGTNFDLVVADLNSVAARVRSEMERIGNIFIPTCDEDEGLHALFYQLLNRRKCETIPFSEHIENITQAYLKAASEEQMPPIRATEFIAPAWIDFTHYNHTVIDNKFYTWAYIPSNSYNMQVYAGWMALFVNAGEGIDLDVFLTQYPTEEIYSKISLQTRLKRADASESHDTDSDFYKRLDTISSGNYMMQGLSSGENFYYLTTLITVVADSLDELEYKYHELEKRVKRDGMGIRRASFMQEEAFRSMLPLCYIHPAIESKAKRNVLTSGASSCYPFISYEMQDPNGIMVGVNRSNNSMVSIDMFDTAIHPNANAVIVGTTGYGKTFTSQLFALRMSLMGVQTFVISPLKGKQDYGGGCRAVGGQFVTMHPAYGNCINIMDVRVPDDEDARLLEGYSVSNSLLTKKIHTVKTFISLVVRDLTQEEEQLLDTSLYKVYERFGITTDNASLIDPTTNQYKEMPLLGDLYDEMANIPELHRIRNILSPLINGSFSAYNQHTNVNLESRYIVFDFDDLKGDSLVLAMFIVLDFVWTKVKEDRTKRKAIFIDECWKLIGTDSNQRAAEDIVEIFRTVRAYGGSAFAMTQDVSQFFEFMNGKYGKAVIGNADTKIIMRLQPNEANKLKEAVSLTNEERDAVTKLEKGQGLVVSSGSRLFVDFVASPFEKNAITTDAKAFYEAAQKARKKRSSDTASE